MLTPGGAASPPPPPPAPRTARNHRHRDTESPHPTPSSSLLSRQRPGLTAGVRQQPGPSYSSQRGGEAGCHLHTPPVKEAPKCFLCLEVIGAEEEPGLVSGISAGAERYRSIPAAGVHGGPVPFCPPQAALLPREQGLQTMPHNDWMGICSLSD